jgi:hypothetical protein
MTEAKEPPRLTTLGEIANVKREETVELPPFHDGTPFVAKLRRPSILRMVELGQIPNPLSTAIDELMSGAKELKSPVKDRAEVLTTIAKAALLDPPWSDELAEVIDSVQLMAIWEFVMYGVNAVLPFRALREVLVGGADERALVTEAESASADSEV